MFLFLFSCFLVFLVLLVQISVSFLLFFFEPESHKKKTTTWIDPRSKDTREHDVTRCEVGRMNPSHFFLLPFDLHPLRSINHTSKFSKSPSHVSQPTLFFCLFSIIIPIPELPYGWDEEVDDDFGVYYIRFVELYSHNFFN